MAVDHSRVPRVVERLVARRETIAVSESSAGGLISAALMSIPGASRYFLGGGIIYIRKAMAALLELGPDELKGIRSATEPMARLLAETVRTKLGADWGLAETGVTGPTGARRRSPRRGGRSHRQEVLEVRSGAVDSRTSPTWR